MIAQLQDDHDRLRDLADQLERYLDGDTPPRDPHFAQLRWMLVRELSMHMAAERKTLAEWQAASGASGEALDTGLDQAFTDHVVTWSGATMGDSWNNYRTATQALLRRLRRRMAFEEARMFPALAGRGRQSTGTTPWWRASE